jgi:hypothetical protein
MVGLALTVAVPIMRRLPAVLSKPMPYKGKRRAPQARGLMTKDKNHARRDRRADPEGLAFRRP